MDAREKMKHAIRGVEIAKEPRDVWLALSQLAKYLDRKVVIPDEPLGAYDPDELNDLLDYLRGAAEHGALGWPVVRESIAREISIFLEEWSNG